MHDKNIASCGGSPDRLARLSNADHFFHWKPQGAEKFAHILSDLAPKLVAIDRYERRALSRRKFAIRDFDAARHTTKS